MHSKNNSMHVNEPYSTEFVAEVAWLNVNRGILFTKIIILFDTILFLVNCYFISKPITTDYNFNYSFYGLMYLLTIIVSLIFMWLFIKMKKLLSSKNSPFKGIQTLALSYSTFIMTWSAVISLFDQRLYGNVAAYLIALIIGSLIFYMPSSLLITPYLISLMIFAIGLPFFQSSLSILIGHYVNVGIFAILSWVMTKVLYTNYMQQFMGRREIDNKNILLNEINQRLREEINLKEQLQQKLEKANQELEKLSQLDQLTGIPNRRNLESFLNKEWKRAIREGNMISFLMIDIDYFKSLNDHYGHLYGDNCLKSVAQTLASCCRRSTDFVARFGGEEFLFVAINIDEEGTRILAENIRNSIESLHIIHEYSETAPYLTVSIGISTIKPTINDKIADSIDAADKALYTAKLAGKNRISISA